MYAVPYQRGPMPGATSNTNGSSVCTMASARMAGVGVMRPRDLPNATASRTEAYREVHAAPLR